MRVESVMSRAVSATWIGVGIVFVLAAVCTGQENTEDTNPVWSPDGASVLFYSYRHGPAQLYQVTLDGLEQRLTETPTFEMFPVFSPDGEDIIFVSDRSGPRRFQEMELYRMKADSKGVYATQLTRGGDLNIFPAVSPDGTRIAFTKARDRFAEADIWVMNADGSEARQLTFSDNAIERAPRWSPDGRYLVFDSNVAGDVDIYVVRADGTGARKVVDGPGYDALPFFSPDGRIVFESSPDKAPNGMSPPAGADIYSMSLDGTNRVRLTHDPDVYDGHAAWSPDGKWIAFHTMRHGGKRKEIYVMRADGSQVTRLTHTNVESSERGRHQAEPAATERSSADQP